MEVKQAEDIGDDDDKYCLETETSLKSFPTKLTHLGFHAQPTKTPITTAIHTGAKNMKSSPNASSILGLRRISNKTESKIISKPKDEIFGIKTSL